MSLIDLHIHSKYSDGTLSPQEIIDYCAGREIKIISITDHNTVDAYDQTYNTADIKLITGVEIDIAYTPDIQCLCYDFDIKDHNFVGALQSIQKKRMQAKVKLVRNLLKMGLIDRHEIDAVCKSNDFNDICEYLANRLGMTTSKEVKEKYFMPNMPLYQQIPMMKLEDCLRLVHQAGGVVILAHPGRMDIQPARLSQLFDRLFIQGIDGFECYHPEHSFALSEFIRNYCINHKCIYSGGSDMHGRDTTFSIAQKKIIPYWRR